MLNWPDCNSDFSPTENIWNIIKQKNLRCWAARILYQGIYSNMPPQFPDRLLLREQALHSTKNDPVPSFWDMLLLWNSKWAKIFLKWYIFSSLNTWSPFPCSIANNICIEDVCIMFFYLHFTQHTTTWNWICIKLIKPTNLAKISIDWFCCFVYYIVPGKQIHWNSKKQTNKKKTVSKIFIARFINNPKLIWQNTCTAAPPDEYQYILSYLYMNIS